MHWYAEFCVIIFGSDLPQDKQQDSAVKSNKERSRALAGASRDTYYIIIGTFPNPENTSIAAEKYRNQGYKTSIISMTGKNGGKAELVSIKTFNNPGEAASFLKEFKSKVDHETWIYSHR